MQVDEFRLWCPLCDKWEWYPSSFLLIALDLQSDKYILTASCITCGKTIEMSRDANKIG